MSNCQNVKWRFFLSERRFRFVFQLSKRKSNILFWYTSGKKLQYLQFLIFLLNELLGLTLNMVVHCLCIVKNGWGHCIDFKIRKFRFGKISFGIHQTIVRFAQGFAISKMDFLLALVLSVWWPLYWNSKRQKVKINIYLK